MGKEGKRKVRKLFNKINNTLNCQGSIEVEQMGCVCKLICIMNALASPRFYISLFLNTLLLYNHLCAPLLTDTLFKETEFTASERGCRYNKEGLYV